MKYDDLKDKTAIVTGAARGIGFASAKLLAEHGATVVIADMRFSLAQESANALIGEGLRAVAAEVDVKSQESIDAMVEDVSAKQGRIDILVNNAGIADATPMLDLTQDAWDNLIDINLRGAQLCTQACLKKMIGQGCGKLIFMASRAGEMGSPLVAPSYCASKGGILALAKSYALFCAPYNINANAIAPGFIETDMTKGRDDPNSVPIKRLGTPLDVAKSVYFLASDLSDYVTGAVIDVNGGLYIR
ncbi:beta-ketoacyl-ACP reductase [Christensenellaceae bacterium]|nr:beta-ketoacyl-ACP reductase [Christensenellaceae bacterium]BDF60073.1 beta-ketoacyl-ACP reductase [Christensenellaceae bacterium]